MIQSVHLSYVFLVKELSLATKLQAAVAAVLEGATCVLGLGFPPISAYSEKLLWQSAKTKWRLTKSWLFTPTHTLFSSYWSWRECIFIKSILINMHAPPWEAHKSMGALLITPRWGRPRNFRLVYRKLSGINMHERTLGNEIEMKSWRAEKRNFYPRRESCLLSCRVVGKYEGYLIGAPAIYKPMTYMPNRKKVYD